MRPPEPNPDPIPSQRLVLSPDVSRGLRSTIAFMVPLLLGLKGWMPLDVFFMALAAQNLAIVDVRGDYRLRVGLLAAMAAVYAGVAALGTAVANDLPAALAATVLVCVASSLWRHFSSDYGPGLAISSSFVFLFALASPPTPSLIAAHTLAILGGAVWGIVIQVAAWPFRPQHPVRRAVADSWVAAADLFDALAANEAQSATERANRIVEQETALRAALDMANTAIAARRRSPIRANLQALNSAAARLSMRVSALTTAVSSLPPPVAPAPLAPELDPVLSSLSNLARSVALTIVSRQPAHLGRSELRLRRSASLLGVFRTRLAMRAPAAAGPAQLAEVVGQIEAFLATVHEPLRATAARAEERTAFSMELLDLRAMALRPLASSLNLSWRIEPGLIRFALRSTLITLIGVLAYKRLNLEHGYWLPFTSMVVLQPDYGSTRRRAAQRVLGTLAGSIAATALLWFRLPQPVLMIACAITIFIFGYWLKRNYGVAVIFITLFVVLITEALMPVTFAIAAQRLGNTLAGGLLALLAAQLFWPMWERDRLPPILATALRRNSAYLRVLTDRLRNGGAFENEAVTAKRRAERANADVFASLNRLNGDPKAQREGLDYAAMVANGNQRITRALNLLALHLAPGAPWPDPLLGGFVDLAGRAFEIIADAVTTGATTAETVDPVLAGLESEPLPTPPPNTPAAAWAYTQLARTTTELCALLVGVRDNTPEHR